MNVFTLIYTTGYAFGFKELVGIYTTKEKAEKGIQRDLINHAFRLEKDYRIEEVYVDSQTNMMLAEWVLMYARRLNSVKSIGAIIYKKI